MISSRDSWPLLTDSQRANLLLDIEKLRTANISSGPARLLYDMRFLIPFGFVLAGVCLGFAVTSIFLSLPLSGGRGLLSQIALALSEAPARWYITVPVLIVGGLAFLRGMNDLIEAEFLARDRQVLYMAELFELLNQRGFPVTPETVELIREARKQQWL